MKRRTIILGTIALVVIEQTVKLITSTYYRDAHFEIIPPLLEFKPILNDKSFYWFSVFGINVERWARLIVIGIATLVVFLFYRIMKILVKTDVLIDVACTFAFAGVICAMSDNIFFGGSWDYIALHPFPVCDLKDLYMNIFACLLIIGVLRNKRYWKTVKWKDVIDDIKKET